MPISGALNNADHIETVEVVELHWMMESDLAMHTSAGITVPALCGAWLDPDPPAGTQPSVVEVRYVSCTTCDALYDLRADLLAV